MKVSQTKPVLAFSAMTMVIEDHDEAVRVGIAKARALLGP